MKNILFDLAAMQAISGNKFHGGGEYAKTIFIRLCRSLPENILLEVFYDPQREIEESILDLCKINQIAIHTCSSNIEITKLLCAKCFNVFYSALPYSYTDLKLPPETKFIYTIHGLRELEYPIDQCEAKYKKNTLKNTVKQIIYFFFFSFWKNHKMKKSMVDFKKLFSRTKNQTIITVSNHSKYAIDYFFPEIDSSNVKIFYSPAKVFYFPNNDDSNILKNLSVESGKYILLIGGNRFIKGAWRSCKVLYHLLHNGSKIPTDIKVIVVGISFKKPYAEITRESSRFVLKDYISAEELEILYKNAFLFLYPTLNEGFGYPPSEAMKYGTPCACSANSAITEVYGDSVLYFNPFDETEMGIRILQSFDENIRNELKQKALLRCQFVAAKQEHDLNLLIQEIIN